jgi:hypothetical protein
MVDFAQLKKNRAEEFQKVSDAVKKMQSGESYKDDRFWTPTVDKTGNGFAVIRFLPAPGDEHVPYISLFEHSFKGPTGQWYIENSRTTLGKHEKDPCTEFNSELWNSTTDDKSPARRQARDQKRNLRYISNIYVVSDPAAPENEGKVFLYKYGKKIFDKVNTAMHPQFVDEKPINPFDFWDGADFKLKIRKVDGQRSYEASGFAECAPLLKDDATLEAVWKKEHSLQEFLKPENFKPYEVLQKRLYTVLGLDGGSKPSLPRPSRPSYDDGEDEAPARAGRERAAPARQESAPWGGDEDEDDDMSYFRKLAQED